MEAVLASKHFKLINFVVVDEAYLAGLRHWVQLRAGHFRDVLDHHRCVASPMLLMSLDDDRKDGLVQQSLAGHSSESGTLLVVVKHRDGKQDAASEGLKSGRIVDPTNRHLEGVQQRLMLLGLHGSI
jgi:hypothetical protein